MGSSCAAPSAPSRDGPVNTGRHSRPRYRPHRPGPRSRGPALTAVRRCCDGGRAPTGVAPGARDAGRTTRTRHRRPGRGRRRPGPAPPGVAGHPARRDHRARGGARPRGAAHRAPPQRHPAALGHLGRHRVGRPAPRPGHGAHRCRGVRRAGPAGPGGRRTARRRARGRAAVGGPGHAGPAAGADPQLVRALVGPRERGRRPGRLLAAAGSGPVGLRLPPGLVPAAVGSSSGARAAGGAPSPPFERLRRGPAGAADRSARAWSGWASSSR